MKNKKIMINVVLLILLELCLFFIMLGHKNIEPKALVTDLYVFSGLFLIASIYLFEKAYKKESGLLAISGIEIMIFSIVLLILPYSYFQFGEAFSNLDKYFAISLPIYFFVKIIILLVKNKIARTGEKNI